MLTIKIEWRASPDRFESGSNAYVGKIRVGSTHWATAKQAGGPWEAVATLPGIRIGEVVRYQATEPDARIVVERAVRKWFELVEPAIEFIKEAQRAGD